MFVGIYWQRYGWAAPGEQTSGLEDEYLLCGDRPKLIYVKQADGPREPRLNELLSRIQADDGASYKPFDEASDLAGLLADDLAVLLTVAHALGRAPGRGTGPGGAAGAADPDRRPPGANCPRWRSARATHPCTWSHDWAGRDRQDPPGHRGRPAVDRGGPARRRIGLVRRPVPSPGSGRRA